MKISIYLMNHKLINKKVKAIIPGYLKSMFANIYGVILITMFLWLDLKIVRLCRNFRYGMIKAILFIALITLIIILINYVYLVQHILSKVCGVYRINKPLTPEQRSTLASVIKEMTNKGCSRKEIDKWIDNYIKEAKI